MRFKSLYPVLTGAAVLFTPACAGPVSESLRPAARPAAVAAVQTPPTVNPAFDRWVAQFLPRARAKGIREDVLDRAFRGVTHDPEVVARDRNQAEFRREIWDYLDSAVNPNRVATGQQELRARAGLLDRIERQYGVEREVLLAVWGMESSFGTRRGDMDVVRSLATLAFDGRRGAFFESQLIAALQIIQAGDVDPRRMLGSWAGAMGHTQFIPTSYLAFAVDFTGDGKRDIWSDDPADSLASTAAYLKRSGWKTGQPWGVEVRLPQGFSAAQADRKIRRTPADWAAAGVTDMNGRPVPNHGPASILLPAGLSGPAFMIFDNFGVILRYNNATSYAMGVGHLADRIGGGPEIQGRWPRGYDALDFDGRMEVQRLLKRRGFEIEKIDGIVGPQTRSAIAAFQRSVGVTADGNPSTDVLRLLKRN